MANRTSSKTIDIQELVSEAANLELKTLKAGMEYWQVWINQSAKFTNIASDTLQAIQDDKASVSDAARRLTAFGRENANVFGDLYGRLSESYFEELDRLTKRIGSEDDKLPRTKKNSRRKKITKKKPRSAA